MDMIERRNRDLLRAARAIYAASPVPMSQQELAAQAARSQAPCYYVTYDYALRVLSRMRRGGRPDGDELRQRMYAEMEAKAAEIQRRRPQATLGQAVASVLAECRASAFFVKGKTVENLMSLKRQV